MNSVLVITHTNSMPTKKGIENWVQLALKI